MPVLRTYCTFKKCFKMEMYLSFIVSFKLRSLVSKLRLSSHSLEIERGRHCKKKIPSEDRLCKLCKAGIEDETFIDVLSFLF